MRREKRITLFARISLRLSRSTKQALDRRINMDQCYFSIRPPTAKLCNCTNTDIHNYMLWVKTGRYENVREETQSFSPLDSSGSSFPYTISSALRHEKCIERPLEAFRPFNSIRGAVSTTPNDSNLPPLFRSKVIPCWRTTFALASSMLLTALAFFCCCRWVPRVLDGSNDFIFSCWKRSFLATL